MCDQFTVGFDSAATTGEIIRSQLRGESPSVEQRLNELTTRRFPELSVETLGLPLFTIAIGLVDGFNPCAMWVLTFLVNARRRVSGLVICALGAVLAFAPAWLV